MCHLDFPTITSRFSPIPANDVSAESNEGSSSVISRLRVPPQAMLVEWNAKAAAAATVAVSSIIAIKAIKFIDL